MVQSEIHVWDLCMDKSKLFDIPVDHRRSGSPMVDPLWGDIMESYQHLMREYETNHMALQLYLAQQETLQVKIKETYEKLRELYRTTLFRRHEYARRSLQMQNSSFTTRHNTIHLEVPVVPPPKASWWASCFRPSPTKEKDI